MDLNKAAKAIGEYADKHRIERLEWNRYGNEWTALVYNDIQNDNTTFVGETSSNVTEAIDETAERYKDKLREY